MSDVISDVSFVVITYNEAFGISKCIRSILCVANETCEVICVDSDSTDDTVEKIISLSEDSQSVQLSLLVIRGYTNAAVGRNVGINYATKKYVYFVDGDIEINPKFVVEAIEFMEKGYCDAVTGGLEEYQYEPDFRNVINTIPDRFGIYRRQSVRISGGCFIARRKNVVDVGYFDPCLRKNEDIDYTLRFTEKNMMLAIPVNMGIHHTVSYDTWERFKRDYIEEYRYYGMVIWKNIRRLRLANVLRLLERYRGQTSGFVMYAMLIIVTLYGNSAALIGPLAFVLIDVGLGLVRGKNILFRMYTHYISPLIALGGIFVPSSCEMSKKNSVNDEYQTFIHVKWTAKQLTNDSYEHKCT